MMLDWERGERKLPTYPEEKWRNLGLAMFEAIGVTKKDAEVVVDNLVTGSLRGIDSHGVRALIPFIAGDPYVGRYRQGIEMKIIKETPAMAVLDACNTYGPISAKSAMEIAINKAKTVGVGLCAVTNGTWIVNLFYYSMIAVEHDMVGITMARDSISGSPYGGTKPITGTNPLCVAIPAGKKYTAIVLDIATLAAAQGHVATLLAEGKPLPDGWLIDRQGRPVKGFDLKLDDLDEFWKTGGSLLPFGGHKGYGINVAIEILCGTLTLMGIGPRSRGQGSIAMAIDIKKFTPVEEFKANVDYLIGEIKSSPLRPGFDEILYPGEREFAFERVRRKEGIPIDEISWKRLQELCAKIGVDVKKVMK
jgi:LDH2 family malate/lactate/ureidoglycolate dehydrogenase